MIFFCNTTIACHLYTALTVKGLFKFTVAADVTLAWKVYLSIPSVLSAVVVVFLYQRHGLKIVYYVTCNTILVLSYIALAVWVDLLARYMSVG